MRTIWLVLSLTNLVSGSYRHIHHWWIISNASSYAVSLSPRSHGWIYDRSIIDAWNVNQAVKDAWWFVDYLHLRIAHALHFLSHLLFYVQQQVLHCWPDFYCFRKALQISSIIQFWSFQPFQIFTLNPTWFRYDGHSVTDGKGRFLEYEFFVVREISLWLSKSMDL